MTHYKVLVDDNFHYMDESERWELGVFSTAEEAIARCKAMINDELEGYYDSNPGITADKLYDLYVSFGSDPFIIPSEKGDPVDFHAWNYAKKRSQFLIDRGAKPEKPEEFLSLIYDATGPIPWEHFDNDFRFNPDVDKSPGSLYDHAKNLLNPPENIKHTTKGSAHGETVPKGTFKYGMFESYAAAYNDYEAWLLINNVWRKYMLGKVRMGVRPMHEGQIRDTFGKLPDLPPEAFSVA